MPDRFFSIRNWKRFQHYKERNPPWIRLYRDLLRDRGYQKLSDTCRGHLVGLLILAAGSDNRIPDDQAWLRHELCTKLPIDLKSLAATGWIVYEEQSDSDVLAEPHLLADRGQLDAPSHLIPSHIIPHEQVGVADLVASPTSGPPGFAEFWELYPKKLGKQDAEKAWVKANLNGQTEAILSALRTQKGWADWVKDEGQFIPYPATWINGKRWKDEITTEPLTRKQPDKPRPVY